MLKNIIFFIYALVVLGLTTYSIHLIILIVLYLSHQSETNPVTICNKYSDLPPVLVQIPLRNEQYVASRILEAVVKLDWPKEKLHIQVLDDSDDGTFSVVINQVLKYQEEDFNITLIHRKNNSGYKAGALSTGLAYSLCDYIAIFDADFIPKSCFLHQTMAHFENNPELAWVQTRWEFMNVRESYVTSCQAIALDTHFIIDHIARNRNNLMMNFNGTAGIWRRSAIEQSGGWQIDTLAEDLDLSYRAQLLGYKCLYLPSVTSPSQLPNNISAFMQQQRRWAKGAAQTLRKLARLILKSRHHHIGEKMMALLHLSGYFTQLLFVLLVVLSLPMTIVYPTPPIITQILGPMSLVPLIYYALSQIALYDDGLKRMVNYPLLALLAISCSVDITLSLLDGFWHWGGVFIRTPKYDRNDNTYTIPEDHEYLDSFYTFKIILFLYSLSTIYIAYTFKVTYYIVPSILFIMAFILHFGTKKYERIKKREK